MASQSDKSVEYILSIFIFLQAPLPKGWYNIFKYSVVQQLV